MNGNRRDEMRSNDGRREKSPYRIAKAIGKT